MTCRNSLLISLVLSMIHGPLVADFTAAADWITDPSYYSHDPQTGERVTQYTPIGPFYTFARTDYLRSGYRHTRSSIQAGHSADHMHVVEEWGRAVRPYGEWRFPFRPYSVPYDLWGPPPFAGAGWGGFFPPFLPPHGWPGAEAPASPYDRQQPPPYYDGSYPAYRSRTPDGKGHAPKSMPHPPKNAPDRPRRG
jgi:hypothetical protein